MTEPPVLATVAAAAEFLREEYLESLPSAEFGDFSIAEGLVHPISEMQKLFLLLQFFLLVLFTSRRLK